MGETENIIKLNNKRYTVEAKGSMKDGFQIINTEEESVPPEKPQPTPPPDNPKKPNPTPPEQPEKPDPKSPEQPKKPDPLPPKKPRRPNPTPPTKPHHPKRPGSSQKLHKSKKSPLTGDTSDRRMTAMAMGVSGITLLLLGISRRKRRKDFMK